MALARLWLTKVDFPGVLRDIRHMRLWQWLWIGLAALFSSVAAVAVEVDSDNLELDLVTRAEAKAHQLAAKLESCRAAGHDIAYPDAALAVAELFCRFSRYDATQSGLRAAAVRSMVYIDQMLEAELRTGDEVVKGRTH
jgi:hypothetical protein